MRTKALRARFSTLRLLPGMAILTAGLVLPGTLTAATYYVANGGSDSNAGAQSQPFKTIRHGISRLRAGDTLYIRGGTYAEYIAVDSNTINLPLGNSWDTAVTIAAYSGETVVLRPEVQGLSVINLEGSSIRYLIFDGFVADGGSIRLAYGPNHVRFTNVEVKNAPSPGIQEYSGINDPSTPRYNEYIDMKVHDNQGHGIYVTSSNILIDNSEFYHNDGFGVHIYRTGGGINDNTVQSSRVYENGQPAGTASGIIVGSGSGNAAIDNEVWGNSIGIQVDSWGPVKTHVENNTVYDNTTAGIWVYPGSLNTVVEGNDAYDNPVGFDIVNGGTSTVLSNN
jgi:Right handed beta helix region/Protein of unknown function (DUF1565)